MEWNVKHMDTRMYASTLSQHYLKWCVTCNNRYFDKHGDVSGLNLWQSTLATGYL